jgi:DNA-binding Xre family transcriptional regulator
MSVREHIALTVAKRIKEDKIITQAALAKGLGISEAAVSKLLKTGQVDYENILNLCTLLKITPNELLGFEINEEERELLDILDKNPKLKAYVMSMKDE